MADLLFESEPCGRCGGSGEYSYNQVNGRTCFGCAGKGVRLTKRGAQAQALYRKMLTRDRSELQAGDVVRIQMMAGPGAIVSCWATVTEVRQDSFRAEHKKYGQYGTNTQTVRIFGTEEQRAEALAKALELQESLK